MEIKKQQSQESQNSNNMDSRERKKEQLEKEKLISKQWEKVSYFEVRLEFARLKWFIKSHAGLRKKDKSDTA